MKWSGNYLKDFKVEEYKKAIELYNKLSKYKLINQDMLEELEFDIF